MAREAEAMNNSGAVTAERRAARWRRGFLRLGIGSAAVWFVFWTCAYEISPYTSHNPEPASFVISVTAWSVLAPCFIVAVVLRGWAAAGFRSNY